MFFVIAFIAFIAAVVLLVVYSVQMKKTQNRYLGKDAVSKIAGDAAENARNRETFITCDYCGTKFDTREHDICPHCGGAYDNDSEWLNRNAVNRKKMEAEIESGINSNKRLVKKLNANRAYKVHRLLAFVITCFVLCVAFVVIALVSMNSKKYKSDKIPDYYQLADYTFTDPLICDNEYLHAEFGNIYFETSDYTDGPSTRYMIEVRLTNKTNKTESIDIDICSFNTEASANYFAEDVAAGKEVVRCINSYSLKGEDLKEIKEMVIYEISAYDDDYHLLFENNDFTAFKTTSTAAESELTIPDDILYENNGIFISGSVDPESYASLEIFNTTDMNFSVDVQSFIVDNESESCYESLIIPAYCHGTMDIYRTEKYTDVQEIMVSLFFECENAASASFTTDYITLNPES